MSLTRDLQRTRKAFDWSVLERMRTPLMTVGAVASLRDARAGVLLPSAVPARGDASLFIARYRFPMLSTNFAPLGEVVVAFDLDAGGDYPFSKPAAQVISSPIPACTHVHEQTGSICLGESWTEARGKKLFAELVVDVLRFLNFDEVNAPSLDGFNGDALQFWREELDAKPLNPNLVYPTLPEDIAFGLAPRRVLRRRCMTRTSRERSAS